MKEKEHESLKAFRKKKQGAEEQEFPKEKDVEQMLDMDLQDPELDQRLEQELEKLEQEENRCSGEELEKLEQEENRYSGEEEPASQPAEDKWDDDEEQDEGDDDEQGYVVLPEKPVEEEQDSQDSVEDEVLFFSDFLETGTFRCHLCGSTCEGVHQLINHYAASHGVTKVLEDESLR